MTDPNFYEKQDAIVVIYLIDNETDKTDNLEENTQEVQDWITWYNMYLTSQYN